MNRKIALHALRRCASTVLIGSSAPTATSRAAPLSRSVRHHRNTLRPTKLVPPWKRSASIKATGAQPTRATSSWHVTMRLRVAGDKRGRTATVPLATRDHVRMVTYFAKRLLCRRRSERSRFVLWWPLGHVGTRCCTFPDNASPFVVARVPAVQIALCAKQVFLRRSLTPVRGVRAPGVLGSWPPPSSPQLLRSSFSWRSFDICCRRSLKMRTSGASVEECFEPFPFRH